MNRDRRSPIRSLHQLWTATASSTRSLRGPLPFGAEQRHQTSTWPAFSCLDGKSNLVSPSNPCAVGCLMRRSAKIPFCKSFACHSYANTRDMGAAPPRFFSFIQSACERSLSLSTFRINTCKSVSKQTTLTFFRINTYEKGGEGVRRDSKIKLSAQEIRRPDAPRTGDLPSIACPHS